MFIAFSKKQAGVRYNLDFADTSGVFDIQKTFEHAGAMKTYETVFAMKTENRRSSCPNAEPIFKAIDALHRPLRLGWLFHRRIINPGLSFLSFLLSLAEVVSMW